MATGLGEGQLWIQTPFKRWTFVAPCSGLEGVNIYDISLLQFADVHINTYHKFGLYFWLKYLNSKGI